MTVLARLLERGAVFGYSCTLVAMLADQRLCTKTNGAKKPMTLRNEMKAAGADVSKMDSHLEKSGVKIAQALDDMLEESSGIEIDGKQIGDVGKDERPRLPAPRRMLKRGDDEEL